MVDRSRGNTHRSRRCRDGAIFRLASRPWTGTKTHSGHAARRHLSKRWNQFAAHHKRERFCDPWRIPMRYAVTAGGREFRGSTFNYFTVYNRVPCPLSFKPTLQRSAIMRAVPSKNTKPEIAVRSMIHGMGFRYSLHKRGLPGKPDIVLVRLKKIVLVHGCFWHGHKGCSKARVPKTRKRFWLDKFEGNRLRDKRNRTELKRLGWDVLIVWQCELKKPKTLLKRLGAFLGLTVLKADTSQALRKKSNRRKRDGNAVPRQPSIRRREEKVRTSRLHRRP